MTSIRRRSGSLIAGNRALSRCVKPPNSSVRCPSLWATISVRFDALMLGAVALLGIQRFFPWTSEHPAQRR